MISIAAANRSTERKFRKRMFKTYEERYGKKYRSRAELNYRTELYEKHMEEIEKFNKENHSWKQGETIFTDMTDEEKKNFLGLFALDEENEADDSFPVTTEGAETQNDAPLLSGSTSPTLGSAAFSSLPQRVNWVTAGIITPVKHQGQCGSCWAFTATALVESLYKRKYGYDVDLSEQELVDCATHSPYLNYGCRGGFNTNGLNYYKVKGSRLESQYPYRARDRSCRVLNAASYKISDYNTIKPRSLVELLKALSEGPVAVAYFVANDFYNYKSGIYSHKAGCRYSTSVNHAVLAVGYDLNSRNPHIIFKNSWGTNFGEDGYFRMSMDLVDFGNGPCNLLKYRMSVAATL